VEVGDEGEGGECVTVFLPETGGFISVPLKDLHGMGARVETENPGIYLPVRVH